MAELKNGSQRLAFSAAMPPAFSLQFNRQRPLNCTTFSTFHKYKENYTLVDFSLNWFNAFTMASSATEFSIMGPEDARSVTRIKAMAFI